MKFGNPLFTSELSGSLGGIVASKARGGIGYFRARIRPGNPRTQAQTLVRSILSSISAAWVGTLNAAERAAWEGIAPDNASGIDAFVAGNTQPLMSGAPLVETAPASLAYPNAQVFGDPAFSLATHTLSLSVPVADGSVNVYVSSPQSPSRGARQFGYQFAGTIDVAGDDLVLPVNHPAYNTPSGRVIYIRLVQFNAATGQVATAQEFRVIGGT